MGNTTAELPKRGVEKPPTIAPLKIQADEGKRFALLQRFVITFGDETSEQRLGKAP